jgi:thioredoxin 1
MPGEPLASVRADGYVGSTMASNDVVTLQDATFDQEVLKSDTPVLVDFWAVWCQPCKAIAPAVEDLARRYKGKLKVAKMDVDEHQRVPQQYGIRSIPTLLLFKGGKVVETVIGADKSRLEDSVKKVVGA